MSKNESRRPAPAASLGGGHGLISGRTAVHAGSCGVRATLGVCLIKTGRSTAPALYTSIARFHNTDHPGCILNKNYPACHKQSIFSRSSGDEMGNRKGIASKPITSKAEFISAAAEPPDSAGFEIAGEERPFIKALFEGGAPGEKRE